MNIAGYGIPDPRADRMSANFKRRAIALVTFPLFFLKENNVGGGGITASCKENVHP